MNKKFKFRLQKILDVRELIEKEREKDLSVSRQKLKSEEENLQKLKNRCSRFTKRMEKINKAAANHFLYYHAYLAALTSSITNKCDEIASIKKEVEQKRQILLEAAQDKKVLEKLKEKKLLESTQVENKIEQAFLDEVARQKKLPSNR